MTQEEKARAYDEALERAKSAIKNCGDNKGRIAMIESIFPALSQSEDEKIRKALIEMVHDTTGDELWVDYNVHKEEALAWLEKQCYTKKDVDDAYLKGICDAKHELDKQGNNTPTIIWHNIDEKPEEMKELFCEWESDDATWHDVAFYDEESHTFRHAKMPINVTKWVYVDELLEKQGEQKPTDKSATTKQDGWLKIPFGAKDSELQEATYYIPNGFHAEIEDDKVVIKKGEKSAAWNVEDSSKVQRICKYLDEAKKYYADITEVRECMDWLKSLKDRIGG